jgi:hypothetical protein
MHRQETLDTMRMNAQLDMSIICNHREATATWGRHAISDAQKDHIYRTFYRTPTDMAEALRGPSQ